MPGRLAIEGLDEGLGYDGHLVDGSMTEVYNPVGMSQGPSCICGRTAVPGIGGGCGIAAREGSRHADVIQCSRKAAIALTLVPAIPAGSGHPDFHLYIGILRRLDLSNNPAKGRRCLQCGYGERI